MSGRQPAEESLLFDLPLDERPAAEPAPVDHAVQTALPLAAAAPPPRTETAPPAPATAIAGRQLLRRRAIAGLTDLGICLSVLVVLTVALWSMEVRPGVDDGPALALFLLAFTFLYQVLPLAFWGRTPGMALAGLRATARDGRQLTFRQTVLRWLGSVLTVALAGLPLVLALGQRSLSDRLSGSLTRLSGPAP